MGHEPHRYSVSLKTMRVYQTPGEMCRTLLDRAQRMRGIGDVEWANTVDVGQVVVDSSDVLDRLLSTLRPPNDYDSDDVCVCVCGVAWIVMCSTNDAIPSKRDQTCAQHSINVVRWTAAHRKLLFSIRQAEQQLRSAAPIALSTDKKRCDGRLHRYRQQ